MDASEHVKAILGKREELQLEELRTSGDCHVSISRLPAQVARCAAELYERVCQEGQAEDLIDWLNSTQVDQCETAEYRATWAFLLMCEILGERGVAPFDSGKLHRFPSPPESLDWSILPAEYHYLVPAAEKYGRIRFPDQIDCFIKYATSADLTVLSQVARRSENDIHELVQWIQRNSEVEHHEVDLVDFMLILLHEIGLT